MLKIMLSGLYGQYIMANEVYEFIFKQSSGE